MADSFAWTSNKVPHFGNSETYKTDKQREIEHYQERLEDLNE